MEEAGNTPTIEIVTKIDGRKKKTNAAEYMPSPKEQQLLNVLTDPEYRLESITRQTERAGVSREFYYYLMRKPAFVTHYRELLKDVIRMHAASLINVAVDHAKAGSFQHLKLLMEMGGLHNQTLEHTGEVNMVVRFIDPMEDDDGSTDNDA